MKHMKSLVFAAATILGSAALAGCGTEAPSSVDADSVSGDADTASEDAESVSGHVSIWGGAHLVSAAEVVLEDNIHEIYPDVDLSFEKYPSAEYPTKLRLQMSSGSNEPDILMMHEYLMPTFIEAGWLLPLQDYVSPDLFIEGSLDRVLVDGELFGLPGQSTPSGFWYRGDVFDDLGLTAPTDWDEYLEVARVLAANGYFIDAMDPNNARPIFLNILLQSGGQVRDDNGVVVEEKGVAALEKLLELWQNDFLAPVDFNSADYWTVINDSGSIVARFGVSPGAAYFKASLDPGGQGGFGEWRYADPMSIDDGPAAFAHSRNFFAVNHKSENVEAAVAIIEYLTTTTDAAKAYDVIDRPGLQVSQTPSDVAGLELLAAGSEGWDPFGGQEVNSTKAQFLLENEVAVMWEDERNAELNPIMNNVLARALSGELSAEEAITEMAEQFRAAL